MLDTRKIIPNLRPWSKITTAPTIPLKEWAYIIAVNVKVGKQIISIDVFRDIRRSKLILTLRLPMRIFTSMILSLQIIKEPAAIY